MFDFGGWPAWAGGGFIIPKVHGADDAAGAGWVGLLENMLDSVTRYFEGGEHFEILPGISTLVPNIHPLLVHFPIAFLNAFFLLDVIGSVWRRQELRRVAAWMLYLGALAAPFTAAAGLFAASFVPHGEEVHQVIEWHQRLGLTVTSLAVILGIWRLVVRSRLSGMANALHLALGGIMVTALFFGADLGGFMVYHHGVGVQHLQVPDSVHHHHHGDMP